MRKLLRWTWRAALAIIVLVVALFTYGYVATWGSYEVKKTVADDPTLHHFTVRGIKLHVRRVGDETKPTVIVLHGGPGGDFRYLLPLEPLSDRYHLVFYDQRGSGLSQRVAPELLTLQRFYEELDGVVERTRKGQKVRLIGHSWGAMLAAGYLGEHPDKVSHAVLAEPGMIDVAAAKRFVAATHNMRPPLTFEAAVALGDAWFSSLHVDGPDNDARRDFFFGKLVTASFGGHPTAGYYCGGDPSSAHLPYWRFGQRVSAHLLEAAGLGGPDPRISFVDNAKAYKGEVLFLTGSCNTLIGEAHQQLQMKHFPRAKLEVIAGAGHTMLGEKPKESIAIIRRFFGEGAAESQPTSRPASQPSSPPRP